MLYVLAFPKFNVKLTASLARFRSKYEPERARLVRPHVTLVFGLSGVDPGAFSDFCEDTLSGARRIQVDFDRFVLDYDPFEGKHKLLLLCRRGREEIASLHRQLYFGPHSQQLDANYPYRPHMTVATDRDRDDLANLDPSAIGELPIQGVLDTVGLVSLSDGSLKTVKCISLKP